jgi:type II secretory pathway component PulL
MRKNKINLLINREDYQKYQDIFRRLRLVAVILVIIFFSLFLIFYLTLKSKNDKVDALNLQKKTLLEILKDKKNDEAKINYFQKKYLDLKTFLKEDAFPSPYYSLLNSALVESSQAATMKSFEINKDREVSFTISFSDFEKLTSFLKFIESETFLNNFEDISLKSFSVAGGEDKSEDKYELSFVGKFVLLKSELLEKI